MFSSDKTFKEKTLLETITDHIEIEERKNLEKANNDFINAKITTPVEDHIHEKIERNIGYKKVIKSMSKWNEVINKNRQAKQLCFFEKQSPSNTKISLDEINAKFKAADQFEKEFDALCKSLGYQDGSVQSREKSKNDLLTFEEKELMRIESAKQKSHSFLQNKKFKRIKKIKSKKYRKKLKALKEKELKNLEKEGFHLETNKDDLIYRRAKERMDLRHTNSGKWAQRLTKKKFLTKNPAISEEMNERNRLDKELRKKVLDSDEDTSSEQEENEFDNKTDNENKNPGGVYNLNFMKRADKRKSKKSEDEDSSEKTQKNEETQTKKGMNKDINENTNSEVPSENKKKKVSFCLPQNDSNDKKITLEMIEEKIRVCDGFSTTLSSQETQGKQREKPAVLSIKERPNKNIMNTTLSQKNKKFIKNKKFDTDSEEIPLSDITDSDGLDEVSEGNTLSTGLVENEFEKEKQNMEAMEEESEKDEQLYGWGSWTGLGIKKRSFAMQKPKNVPENTAAPALKKALKNVIMNKKAIQENLKQISISKLPKSKNFAKKYNEALSEPVGLNWNSTEDFRSKIEPKILKKKGIEIDPLCINDSIAK